MAGPMTYRNYLQYHANNHASDIKKDEARALLNVVGDDQNINGYFLTGNGVNKKGQVVGEQESNGFKASSINRVVNPWWQDSYARYLQQYQKDKEAGLHPDYKQSAAVTGTGGSTMTYDPRAVAFLDQQIAKFPGLYQNINQQRQNKINLINEGYDKAEYDVNNDYALAKRNYEFDTQQRLKTRDKRLAGNDADYKNKTDSWQRYLNMLGVGRSGTADVVIPDLLSKEASYAKDQIEEENALNATKANNAWEETERKKTRTLSDLMSGRRRDTAEANESYDNLLSQQKDKEAELRNKRGQMQGRTLSSILGETNPIIQEAERLSTQATSHAKNLPQIKRDEIKYDAIEPDKFRLDRKESNINTTQPGQDDETIKNVEEEKKKKYMTLSSLVGA